MTNLNYLIEKIKDWAIDRNLHTGDPAGQICKLFEEGESVSELVVGK